jgi:hypothetical protein
MCSKSFGASGVRGMLALGYNIVYFEAFDEPFKPKNILKMDNQ